MNSVANKGKIFTKTELAVTIMVVLILLAVSAPSIPEHAFQAAFRAKNKANAINLKTAIIAYNTDYGNLPIPNGVISTSSDLLLGIPPGIDPSGSPLPGTAHLFQGLCGNVNAYTGVATSAAVTGLNGRNIQYLILSKGQVDKDGILIQSSFKSRKGADTYFGIMMDTQYNNSLKGLPDPFKGTFTLTVSDVTAIWCNNDQPFTTPNIRWSTTY